jgi:hypothetical protein
MRQVSVRGAKVRPAPTNAERAMKAGWMELVEGGGAGGRDVQPLGTCEAASG